MDQYINIVMATLHGLAAEDWAVAAAVLFCTVFIMRSLRMVQRTTPAAMGPDLRDLSPMTPQPTRPQRPAQNALRPIQAKPARRPERLRADANAETQDTRFHDSVLGARAEAAADAAMPADDVAQALTSVRFTGTSLMKWQEYCLLRDVEALLTRLGSGHRLFCHVALSEFFSPTPGQHSPALCNAVEKAVAPYRVDFLVVDRQGYPALGLGFGSTDPVVRTVFTQAGLPNLTVKADYDWTQLEQKLTQVLGNPSR
ncbi:MAG: hypothetical protein ACJA0F_002490, partial [Dinoroseobacter sp.]